MEVITGMTTMGRTTMEIKTPKEGKTIKTFFSISNIGTKNATNIVVLLYTGEKLEQKITIPKINSGFKTTFSFNFYRLQRSKKNKNSN